MRFQANGKRINLGGKMMRKDGKGKFKSDINRVQDSSLVGMMDGFVRSKKWMGLSQFSYYDPDKKICKLCYEDVTPTDTPEGLVLLNTVDGKPHRSRVGKKFYCKMSMRYGN